MQNRRRDIPFFFFFNETAPTEISTLPLPDALPNPPPFVTATTRPSSAGFPAIRPDPGTPRRGAGDSYPASGRSEEHTSELQSRQYLVCRLLLEKKKQPQASSRPVTRTTSTTGQYEL